MNEKMKTYLDQNIESMKEGNIKFAIKDIKKRIQECTKWIERIEQVDENKSEFGNLSNVVYNIGWLQHEVMRLYEKTIEFNRDAVEAQTFSKVLENAKVLEQEEENE